MPPSSRPHPPRSNPHIRLNSDPLDLVLPELSGVSQAPKTPSKSLGRHSRLRREPASSKSLYNFGNGTSAELLLPPESASGSQNPRDCRPTDGTPPRASRGNGHAIHRDTNARQRASYGAFLLAGDVAESSSQRPVQELLRVYSDDGSINTQTVADKFTILPSATLILFPEDVELDDWLHTPDADDRIRLCTPFSGRGFLNVAGLVLMIVGTFVLFIGYPAL